LRDASARRGGEYSVPHSLEGHTKMTYTPLHVRMPEHSVINLKNTSYSITAEFTVTDAPASGVLACQGGNMAGWSLYLDESGKPVFLYNCFGHDLTFVKGKDALTAGDHKLVVTYMHDGGFGAGGEATLSLDGVDLDSARLSRTVPVIFSMSGETFDVGRDTGAPVGPYPHDYAFTGKIKGITLERLEEPDEKVKAQERKGRFEAGLSSQ
ncbi:MAG: hypothetical protein KDI36_17635, partial [Pseudomonadales bacterium]|nr:hypothetical protein [Pseudomonadales bacterium]